MLFADVMQQRLLSTILDTGRSHGARIAVYSYVANLAVPTGDLTHGGSLTPEIHALSCRKAAIYPPRVLCLPADTLHIS